MSVISPDEVEETQTPEQFNAIPAYDDIVGSNTRPLGPGEFVNNPDGSWSNERTTTTDDNQVIPRLWLKDGKPETVSEDEAADLAQRSGLKFPQFDSRDEAEKFANDREANWQNIKPEDSGQVPPLWTPTSEAPALGPPPPTSTLQDKMTEARLSGHSWDDIHQFLDDSTDAAKAAGYQDHEINDFLGFNGSTLLGDQIEVGAHISIANAEDGTHPVEAATNGAVAANGDVKVTPNVAQTYARALMNGEVNGPQDFAETYMTQAYDAAAQASLNPYQSVNDAHRAAAQKELAAQLPTAEDLTDHAIAVVQASGHQITPDLVNTAKEQLIDRWADTGKTLQQSLDEAKDDPTVADFLTRQREFMVPPSLADISMPKRDMVVDPFDAVGHDIYSALDSVLGLTATAKAQDEWNAELERRLKASGIDRAKDPVAAARIELHMGISPVGFAAGMGSVGGVTGKGVSARFSSRFYEALNEAKRIDAATGGAPKAQVVIEDIALDGEHGPPARTTPLTQAEADATLRGTGDIVGDTGAVNKILNMTDQIAQTKGDEPSAVSKVLSQYADAVARDQVIKEMLGELPNRARNFLTATAREFRGIGDHAVAVAKARLRQYGDAVDKFIPDHEATIEKIVQSGGLERYLRGDVLEEGTSGTRLLSDQDRYDRLTRVDKAKVDALDAEKQRLDDGFRPVQPGEVHQPGQTFQMDQTTGQSYVYQEGLDTAPRSKEIQTERDQILGPKREPILKSMGRKLDDLDDLTKLKLYLEAPQLFENKNPFPIEHPLYGLTDTLHDVYQGAMNRLQANPLFDGMGFHEDFYRHSFQNPNKVDQVFGVGREGSTASTKARARYALPGDEPGNPTGAVKLPTELQAIFAGLRPKIPHPINSTLNYLDGILKYEATLNTVAMGRSFGLVRWSPSDSIAPKEHWVRMKGYVANTARRWGLETSEAFGPEDPYGPHQPAATRLLEDHFSNRGEPVDFDFQPRPEDHGGEPARPTNDPKLIEWQAQHIPQAVRWRTPYTDEAIINTEAQQRGNLRRIDELKSLIAMHEAHGWETAELDAELAARTQHNEHLTSRLAELRERYVAERAMASSTDKPRQLAAPGEQKRIPYTGFSLHEAPENLPQPSDFHIHLDNEGKPYTGPHGNFTIDEHGNVHEIFPGREPSWGTSDIGKEGPPRGPHQPQPVFEDDHGQMEHPQRSRDALRYELNREGVTEKTAPPLRPREAATKVVSYAWAPRGYARAYKSWVGRGFHDIPVLGPTYKILSTMANAMTAFKLSLSGYHLSNMAQESGVAEIARAYGKGASALRHGDFVQGVRALKDMGFGAAFPAAMTHLWNVGKVLENNYLERQPGMVGSAMQTVGPYLGIGGHAMDPKLVELFIKAGGRVGGRDTYYRASARGSLFNTWRETISSSRYKQLWREAKEDFYKYPLDEWNTPHYDPGDYPQRSLANPVLNVAIPPARWAAATVDWVSRAFDSLPHTIFLFDRLIPRIKQGAWATEMSDWLMANRGADHATQLTAARHIMDSIDDRFGELNQDNMFLNRFVKQTLNLFTVSLGWELGTLRAMYQGTRDLGVDPALLAGAKWQGMSTRARWVPAVLTMWAWQNNISQYIHTGSGTWNTNQSFWPNMANTFLAGHTGGKDNELEMWPSYSKELVNFISEALKTPDFMGAWGPHPENRTWIDKASGLAMSIPGAVASYGFSKINSFWTFVKQTLTGKDWDNVGIRTKYEVAHNVPPNGFQLLSTLLANAMVPISTQQLGTPSWFPSFLQSPGTRKAGTNISKIEQLMGARPAPQVIANTAKFKAELKYQHDLELQTEAKREHKAALNLEVPDYPAAETAQEVLARATQALAQDKSELGFSSGSVGGGGRSGSGERENRAGRTSGGGGSYGRASDNYGGGIIAAGNSGGSASPGGGDVAAGSSESGAGAGRSGRGRGRGRGGGGGRRANLTNRGRRRVTSSPA